MMKVVQIIPRLYPGGAERLVLQYAEEFSTRDCSVHVMSSVGDGALRPLFERTNAELIVGSREKHGGRWGVWKFLKRELMRIQPDIVHTHLMGGDMIGYLWKRMSPKTIWISTAHNVEFHTSLLKRIAWKMFLKKADAVIAVSDAVAAYSHEHFSVPEEKIHIIYNGVDTKQWKKIPAKVMHADTLSFATIGRLEEQKGHVYALQALAQLQNIPWTYHVYGQGSLENSLKHSAQTLGIADRVIWHGQHTDMARAFEEIDVVVQPSLWEGMSLVVLESMAVGRVVVASSAAGSGIIEDGVTGYLCETGNAADLARVLRTIVENSQDSIRIAKRGRVQVEKRFDINNHYRAVKNLYSSLLSF
ncbi:MAG TPA: glycosyltransferase [Candidatus Magasanikbacteria bacterium]|nr:glycosyltransferase [Candidatus Magasanikbacteria bacterium]